MEERHRQGGLYLGMGVGLGVGMEVDVGVGEASQLNWTFACSEVTALGAVVRGGTLPRCIFRHWVLQGQPRALRLEIAVLSHSTRSNQDSALSH